MVTEACRAVLTERCRLMCKQRDRQHLVDDWLQLSRFDQLPEEDHVLDAQHWSA